MSVGAFDLGNALRAAAGGAVISAGWGRMAVPIAGAVLAAGDLMPVFAGRVNRPMAERC